MSTFPATWLTPDWPAPANVRAVTTTREGGVSRYPYEHFNLASHVDDDPADVAANRAHLAAWLELPAEPLWLNQVHGTRVVDVTKGEPRAEGDAQGSASAAQGRTPVAADAQGSASAARGRTPVAADASVALAPGEVCVVLTADCLPVLFCDRAGTRVGAAHAGWRGLAAGVLEATVKALACPGDELLAWLGPAIGPEAFEVGDDVRDAFFEHNAEAEAAFRPSPRGRWLADIYYLAQLRLNQMGITAIYGGGLCTYADEARFYSYRRDGVTGRMGSLVWIGN